MTAAPHIARDLERHFANELMALVNRHTTIMAHVLEPSEIILAMTKAGNTLHLSAMATTIANSEIEDRAAQQQILATLRGAIGGMLEAATDTVINKAVAARAAQGGGTMTRLRALAASIGVVNAGVATLLVILAALAFRTADAWLGFSIASAAISVAIMPPVDGWTFLRVRR